MTEDNSTIAYISEKYRENKNERFVIEVRNIETMQVVSIHECNRFFHRSWGESITFYTFDSNNNPIEEITTNEANFQKLNFWTYTESNFHSVYGRPKLPAKI